MAESTITRRVGGGAEINETLQNFTVASGQTITAGTFVDFGLASATLGSASPTFVNTTPGDVKASALSNEKIIIVYADNGSKFKIGNISGTTVSWGNEFSFSSFNHLDSGQLKRFHIFALSSTKVLLVYTENGAAKARIATVSGDNISFGAEVTFLSQSVGVDNATVTLLNSSKAVMVFKDGNNNGVGIVLSISGDSITSGSTYNHIAVFTSSKSVVALSESQVALTYQDSPGNGFAKIGTISGTAISWGTAYQINTGSFFFVNILKLSSSTIIIIYQDQGNSSRGTAIVGSVSGTVITFGSETVFDTASTTRITAVTLPFSRVLISYRDGTGALGNLIIGTVNEVNRTISWGTELGFVGGVLDRGFTVILPNNNKVVLGYVGDGSGKAKVRDEPLVVTNTTAEKVSGLAKTGGTAGQTIEVYTNT